MPPIKKTVPRAVKKTAPVFSNDDITQWENNQPAVTVVRDEPNDDDYFPGDEEIKIVKPEVPPNVPSPVATKARSLLNRAKLAAKPTTKKPRTPKPRVSVDRLIGGAWQMLAQLTAPINMPVARVLDMQAPVAGMLLEDVVKNTVVDRILQPIARVESGGETAFALIGPPLLVGLITQKPQMAPILLPMLRQSLMSWIEIAGPKLEEVEKKEKKFAEQYGQRIDQMISYFIAEVDSPNGTNNSHQATATAAAGGTTG